VPGHDREQLAGAVDRVVVHRGVREDLGFEPATDLAAGLRAEFVWVCARAAARPGAIASAG
jgi:hypothetical protein